MGASSSGLVVGLLSCGGGSTCVVSEDSGAAVSLDVPLALVGLESGAAGEFEFGLVGSGGGGVGGAGGAVAGLSSGSCVGVGAAGGGGGGAEGPGVAAEGTVGTTAGRVTGAVVVGLAHQVVVWVGHDEALHRPLVQAHEAGDLASDRDFVVDVDVVVAVDVLRDAQPHDLRVLDFVHHALEVVAEQPRASWLASALKVGYQPGDDGVHDAEDRDENVRALAGAQGCQNCSQHDLR
jgi:hypothetical protein